MDLAAYTMTRDVTTLVKEAPKAVMSPTIIETGVP
jgi:hypothetical protein